MNKQKLKEKIINNIDSEYAIEFLKALVRLPSASKDATLAQELVNEKLFNMSFEVDRFKGNADIEDLDDYCPVNGEIHEGAYNLVGKKRGKGAGKSLMLFSHIDTEPYPKDVDKALFGEIADGKFYGLGAADAKGGIAMMLLASEYVLKETELDSDLTLMSVLGKEGGSAGTLTAISRGYKADGGIYVHPAETGHSFQELKCYSMGVIDFKVTVKGKAGDLIDELNESEENAIIRGAKLVNGLVEFNRERQERLVFDSGDFEGNAKTKLNIGFAKGGTYSGKDPLSFEVHCRLYFAYGETISSVLTDLDVFIKDWFKDDEWIKENPIKIEKLFLRASPAYIEEDHELIKAVIQNVNQVKGQQKYIFQYHGASDIRLPIIYGNTPTVGIGPLSGGFYGSEWTDWIDIEDYISGIKILVGVIIDWCIE